VLPDNLLDSLRQAAAATQVAIGKGIARCVIEILLPEFWDPSSGAVFAEEGDQMRFWQLTRRFADNLIDITGSSAVTVVRVEGLGVRRVDGGRVEGLVWSSWGWLRARREVLGLHALREDTPTPIVRTSYVSFPHPWLPTPSPSPPTPNLRGVPRRGRGGVARESVG